MSRLSIRERRRNTNANVDANADADADADADDNDNQSIAPSSISSGVLHNEQMQTEHQRHEQRYQHHSRPSRASGSLFGSDLNRQSRATGSIFAENLQHEQLQQLDEEEQPNDLPLQSRRIRDQQQPNLQIENQLQLVTHRAQLQIQHMAGRPTQTHTNYRINNRQLYVNAVQATVSVRGSYFSYLVKFGKHKDIKKEDLPPWEKERRTEIVQKQLHEDIRTVYGNYNYDNMTLYCQKEDKKTHKFYYNIKLLYEEKNEKEEEEEDDDDDDDGE